MEEALEHALTASGARIAPVSADAAAAFLERVGERGLAETWVAFGARQDDGPTIGVAVLGASFADDGRVMVAVAPAWRRLHIGRELLHSLEAEARRRDLRHLRVTYSTDAVLADAFVRSCGYESVRQIANGLITALLFVPGDRHHAR